MAIADTINSIETHLKDGYEALEQLGVSVEDRNVENIKDMANQIYSKFPKTDFEEGTNITLANTNKGKLEFYGTNANKNYFNETLYNGQVGSNGGYSSSTNRITNISGADDIGTTLLQAGTYTLSVEGLQNCTLLTKNASGTIIDNFANVWQTLPFTFTLTQEGYVSFTARKSNNSNISPSDYNVIISGVDNLLYGDTKQETLTGKNLCETNYLNWEVGEYNLGGTKVDNLARARVKELLPVPSNTTIYITTFTDPYRIVLRGYDENKDFVVSYGAMTNEQTLYLGQTIKYLGVIIYNPNHEVAPEGQTIITNIQNGTIKPFMCNNTITDKTFEEYCGGIPSPNPRISSKYTSSNRNTRSRSR